MKLIPPDAACYVCGEFLHIHLCRDCKRWVCWPHRPDGPSDYCIACWQQREAEREAGVTRLEPKSGDLIFWR